MDKHYTSVTTNRTPRPRSKRLRECNVEFPSAQVQAQGTLDLSGKVDVDFFSMLFEAQDSDGNVIRVNSTTGNIHRLRVKCNLFSDFGVSALGYGPGGGGGGVTLNNVLEGINNTTFPSATPSSAGQAIVWDGTKWTFGTAGGGGTDLNAVWASLEAEDSNKQIDLSHLTTALAGYATQSWVTSQGYLTSLPSHNHDDRYKFGTIGIGTVQITLGGTTKSVLTNHQSLADYVKTIQLGTNGTVYSPTSGKVTLPAYPTTLPASDVYSWAKAANKPSYSFSEINNHPTTLAGYGITDAKISNGVITLGSNSITPLTSFTETDPTVPSWAKQSSKPSYAFSEITGSVAASQLPTMYWADVAISDESNNNTSPQFGNLRLRPGSSNYGSYLRFGDGNYCYLYEDSDDHLKIYGSKGIELLNDNSYNIKLNDLFHVYKGGIAGSSLNFPDSTPFTSYTFYNVLRSTTHTIDLFVKSTLNIANNSAIRWQNSSGSIVTGMRLNNNNQFEIGYGMAGFNYESRIYGGSTTGIKFYCGESTEVASVYRNTVNNVTYQGLRIGDALLSWDSTNNALKVQRYDGAAVNFYSLGGVSALGFTAGANESISKLTITDELKFDNGDFSHTIYDDGSGILHINASEGLEIGSDLMIPYNMVVANEVKSPKFYLDSTRYIYLDGTTLKYYNGSQSKTIVLS